MNEGKKFEEDFIKSLPENIFHYRLRDSGGSWQGGEKARFTPTNICDFIVYTNSKLLLLELKSHKGKSIPLSCIRKNQIDGLMGAYRKGIKAGYIFNFRDIEQTYFLSAFYLDHAIRTYDRKSIPLDYVKADGILIPQTLKKVRYRYDLSVILGN